MTKWSKRCLLACLCAAAALPARSSEAADACMEAQIAPALVIEQSGTRGRMNWRPVEGAQSYRVRIVRQVPEGPRLEESDSLTFIPEHRWSLRPHARPTKLRYSVRARCLAGEGTVWTGQAVVEPAGGCDPVVLRAAPVTASMPHTLAWNATSGGQVEIAEYDRLGRLVSRSSSLTDTHTFLPTSTSRAVMLRRVCGDAASSPLFYLLP